MNVIGLTLNFRDVERTTTCIRSLLGEGIPHVMVWDNSDDDGQAARALSERFARDERVSIRISPNGNIGFAAGVNRGLEAIASDHGRVPVLLINNDAVLAPGALAALSDALEQQAPPPALVVPSILQAGEYHGLRYYQRWSGLLFDRIVPGSFPFASGCCLLVATSRTGTRLFDEDFFMYGEDAELGYRLHQEPDALRHVPEAIVRHEGSGSSGMATLFYESHVVAAHLLLAHKLASSTTQGLVFLLNRMALLPLRACIRACRYRSWIPLQALVIGRRLARRGATPLKNPISGAGQRG